MWINNELFIEKEIPSLHPASLEYREYWREQKRRCIEGYWVGGKWMPGNLYFYVNFWTILLNKKSSSTAKQRGRPLLWDIFWETAYNWVEARGLAGFEKQPEIISLENGLITLDNNPELITEEELLTLRATCPDIRDLTRHSTVDLGAPKFLSEASNLIWMANRGCGKSYFAAGGVIAHEYLFDGLKEYTQDSIKNPPKTEVLVGAGDTKYSTDLLKKVMLGLENLPGGIEINGVYYPSPLFKKSKGTLLQSGSVLEHRYSKKIGGVWKDDCGTGSFIKHVTYRDNPFAGQGTRPAVAVKEEIGMFDSLEAAMEADLETQMDGTRKFGSTLLMGTGGDMEGGTVSAHKIFYAPKTYQCLEFEDKWENKGKIGYFTPSTHGKRQYKDKNGNTREEFAKNEELKLRESKRKGKNASSALDAHVQYNPLVPSEVFLTKTGNIFPKKELSDWLAIVENNPKYEDADFIGDIVMDEDGGVKWKPKHDLPYDINPIKIFPVDTKKDDIEGCIVIWEHPYKDEFGNTPFGLYVAGTDPYDHDESGTPSLGSTFIYKRFQHTGEWYDIPVAEYTGRPSAENYYKKLINLLIYYNARCMYENEKKGLHQYAELKGYDYLLMEQPGYIKDVVENSRVQRGKGIHMSTSIKVHGETLIKNWLEEEYAPGKLNLTKLRSVPLIKELISYNRDGNFDRCLVPGTLISTINGYKRVETITTDDYVLTHLGNYKKVTMLDNSFAKDDLIRISQIGDYRNLTVTKNHPIYSAYTTLKKHSNRTKALDNIDFIEAKDLVHKYQFGLVPKRKGLIYNNYSDDLLYLLGWIMSDGYISDKNQIKITLQLNQESIADKLMTIDGVYENDKVYNGRTYVKKGWTKKIVKTKTGGYILITRTSEELAKIARRFGYKANDKKVAMSVFTTCNLMPFVIGFLEGDGHQKLKANYDGYKREVLECSGIYEELMHQIRQILIDNGIWCSIRKIKAKNGRKSQYSISINNEYINKLLDLYPSLKFSKVNSKTVKNNQLETEHGFWTPIKTTVIPNTEMQQVYNFEVQDDHSYIADGIATHNCMAFMCCMYAIKERERIVTSVADRETPIHQSDFFTRNKFNKQTFSHIARY